MDDERKILTHGTIADWLATIHDGDVPANDAVLDRIERHLANGFSVFFICSLLTGSHAGCLLLSNACKHLNCGRVCSFAH